MKVQPAPSVEHQHRADHGYGDRCPEPIHGPLHAKPPDQDGMVQSRAYDDDGKENVVMSQFGLTSNTDHLGE